MVICSVAVSSKGGSTSDRAAVVAAAFAAAIGSMVIMFTTPTPAEATSVMPKSTAVMFKEYFSYLFPPYFTPKRLGFTYLLIRGTHEFMIRIANDMPSG